MSGQFSSAHLVQIFTQARCLQITRIEKVFAQGFRLPEEVCKNYTQLYREKCQGCKGEEGSMIYQKLFIAFWTEVRKLIAIPVDLNRLDLITLFGEIATGERLASGALACRGVRIVLRTAA